jgi:Flp pilus assembly protein TadG
VSHGRRGSDQGAAAVEFALVLPLLLMLVFGIIDFGRMLTAKEQLAQAARAAAQAQLVGGSPDQAARDVFTAGTVNVNIVARCPINPSSSATVKVRVDYRFEFVTPIAVLAGFVGGDPVLSATGVVPCRG